MQRFYVTFPLRHDLVITDDALLHQLTRVLRSRVGDEIILFDGSEVEMLYEITNIAKKSLSLRGKSQACPKTEPMKSIALYQALPNKIEKIEYILQKGVEVGIQKFVFFRSDYSQKLVLGESKKERFISIAREALEQCGGLVMPEIEFLDTLSTSSWHILEARISDSMDPEINSGGQNLRQTQNIVLDTTGNVQKLTEMPQNREISIWVGPEGGWSDKERIKMKNNGFIFVRFGERVLRTETAGVVVGFGLLHG